MERRYRAAWFATSLVVGALGLGSWAEGTELQWVQVPAALVVTALTSFSAVMVLAPREEGER